MDNKVIEQEVASGSDAGLSQKEKFLEFLSVGICLMLLIGCFLKVIFF